MLEALQKTPFLNFGHIFSFVNKDTCSSMGGDASCFYMLICMKNSKKKIIKNTCTNIYHIYSHTTHTLSPKISPQYKRACLTQKLIFFAGCEETARINKRLLAGEVSEKEKDGGTGGARRFQSSCSMMIRRAAGERGRAEEK